MSAATHHHSNHLNDLKQRFNKRTHHPVVVPKLVKNGFPPATPGFFEARQKEQRQKQLLESKKAQQQAARYNLTLRALSLASAKKAQLERNLSLQSTITLKKLTIGEKHEQDDIHEMKRPKSMQRHITFEVIPERQEEEEKERTSQENVGKEEEVEQVVAETAPPSDAALLVTTTLAPGQQEETIEQKETEGFSMPEVEAALMNGNDEEINEALVNSFFETSDPEKKSQSKKLLLEYKGREEELMTTLLNIPSDLDRYADVILRENEDENMSFITSGRQSDMSNTVWNVTTVMDAQVEMLRKRLLEKGANTKEIDKVLEETSEML